MKLTRREFSHALGFAAVASPLVGGRALAQTPEASPAASGWSFTDFRDVTVELDETPTRVVAQTTSAASLWDFGVECVGFFGPNDYGTDFQFTQVGRMDVPSMTQFGDWGELDLEGLVATDADIYVDLFRGGETLWYLGDAETEERVRQICPTIGIDANGVPFLDTVQEFERLAVALGAEPEGDAIAESKAALAEAEALFKESLAGKEALKVVPISLNPDGSAVLWNGNWLSDLQYMQDLGMTTVDVGVADDVPNLAISVEQLGEYPADVYLVDSRESLEDYEAVAIWNTLPAVQAG